MSKEHPLEMKIAEMLGQWLASSSAKTGYDMAKEILALVAPSGNYHAGHAPPAPAQATETLPECHCGFGNHPWNSSTCPVHAAALKAPKAPALPAKVQYVNSEDTQPATREWVRGEMMKLAKRLDAYGYGDVSRGISAVFGRVTCTDTTG